MYKISPTLPPWPKESPCWLITRLCFLLWLCDVGAAKKSDPLTWCDPRTWIHDPGFLHSDVWDRISGYSDIFGSDLKILGIQNTQFFCYYYYYYFFAEQSPFNIFEYPKYPGKSQISDPIFYIWIFWIELGIWDQILPIRNFQMIGYQIFRIGSDIQFVM